MTKRTKKAAVKPEQRQDWLERHELAGESPPKIAAKDGYDVRTVRKQIALAKEEREMREARATVLRNALERHYEDLLAYAQYLEASFSGLTNVEMPQDADLLEIGLRQHLPRSPIWAYKLRLQNMAGEIEDQRQRLDAFVEKAIKEDANATALNRLNPTGLDLRLAAILRHQTGQWAAGFAGMALDANLGIRQAQDDQMSLVYGIFPLIDRIGKEDARRIQGIAYDSLQDLENRVRSSQEFQDFQKVISESRNTLRKLREEIATIRLRRILTGKCKYCPL
jgi:hypothetical protein